MILVPNVSKLEQDRIAIEHLVHLKEDIKAHGYTQAGLARLLGVNKNTFQNWITRHCNPSPEHYNSLAVLLGWPLFERGRIS